MNAILAVLLWFTGMGFGWLMAHDEIKTECERQGSFYVGGSVFVCEVKP